jgi:tRNA(Met) cytidine acetyltransferase
VNSSAGAQLHHQAHERFHLRLPHLLAEPLRDLDAEIVAPLMRRGDTTPPLQLSAAEWRDLHTFAHANLGLETVIAPLWQLMNHHFVVAKLPLPQQALLVSRVLQRNSWAEVCRVSGYNGKNEALKALRQGVVQLIDLYQR